MGSIKERMAALQRTAAGGAPPPTPPRESAPRIQVTPKAEPVREAEPASPPASLSKRRSSHARAIADDLIKPAWTDFLGAATVLDTVEAYQQLRTACNVPDGAFGRPGFDAVLEATVVSQVPHKTKSLMHALADNWKKRPVAHAATRVVISGAGPVGLRAAVEAAQMGMRVHVVEKRDIFSRVNILMLWQPTADDLIAYGARTFYSKFTNRNIGNSPLHLGTREIQLVLLKNALLLGVTFSYGTELVAVQAPALGAAGRLEKRKSVGGWNRPGGGDDGGGGGGGGKGWHAWLRAASSTATHQTTGGVLDFKPRKAGEYKTGAGQGKCNQLQTSDLDEDFALPAGAQCPEGVERVAFDALILAEGEWSETCKRLGVTKSIDRFTQAIGPGLHPLPHTAMASS